LIGTTPAPQTDLQQEILHESKIVHIHHRRLDKILNMAEGEFDWRQFDAYDIPDGEFCVYGTVYSSSSF
jgi:hypothetical protein